MEFVDAWLDKETQKITLKRCFYDTSFKKQTLKELERVIFLTATDHGRFN
ncbi:hypothetical protein XM264_2894 [Enterococcus faecalis]|nr:hypothetical protein XM264_2894 [Enterococcus faecalis]